MAIPHVFSAVKPNDFTVQPLVVHKSYRVARQGGFYSGSMPLTSSGYRHLEALHFGEPLKLGTAKTYPTNSFDGSNKHIVWHSVNQLYYKFPYDTFSTLEHGNANYTRKRLYESASVLSIPQHDFGEGVKVGSVELTSSLYNFQDDGNGNLVLKTTGSLTFAKQYNLLAHWDFNEVHRLPATTRDEYGRYTHKEGEFIYKSNTNNWNLNRSFIKETLFVPRSTYTNPKIYPGYCSWFQNSYILTDHKEEFNFGKTDDFTISFDFYYISGDYTGVVMNKRAVVKREELGQSTKLNQNGTSVEGLYYSSSYVDQLTTVYPFNIEFKDLGLVFSRSDGINTLDLSVDLFNGGFESYPPEGWQNYAVTKSGSLYSAYINGNLIASQSNSRLGHCQNRHALMFQKLNQALEQPSPAILANVRFYDTALNHNEVRFLRQYDNDDVSQNKIVGNVFYKQGFVILTSENNKYNTDLQNNDFTLRFDSTNTIYQYECLARIKKGDYNLTLNPSALQNPNSDLLKHEMTGSLSEGALYPYFTEIGLCNQFGELLVIGKTSQPVQIRDDVDLNVICRWYI